MRLLVDSHVVLWAAVADPRLRGALLDRYVDPEVSLVVSTATVWEVSIQYSLGKLPLPVPPSDFFAREIATRGYEVLEVRRAYAERTASLPWPPDGHRDPFDRLLVSTALVEGLPLLSGDRRLHGYAAHGLVLAA